MNKPQEWGAKLARSYGKLTFTAAGQGVADLIKMPAGRVIILPDLCRVVCPAGAAGATLDIGYAAHVNDLGVAVVADPDALLTAEVITGAIDMAFTDPTNGELELVSQDGFSITATVAVANSPAAGDLLVSVVYAIGR
jgi:hypothetical protein